MNNKNYNVRTVLQEMVVEEINNLSKELGIAKTDISVHTVPGCCVTQYLDLRYPLQTA